MNRRALPLIVCTFIYVTTTAGASAEELQGTAIASNLTVKVTLTPQSPPWGYRIVEYFSTNDPKEHSVECASGYLDLVYILRDASGTVVVAQKDPWKLHSDVDLPTSYSSKGPPDPCNSIKLSGTVRVVYLSWLYPTLKPGIYTLQVILAPRGTLARAATGPFTLTVH
jgi:hypothetical protein